MKKRYVYVSRPIPGDALELLQKYCRVEVHDDIMNPPSKKQILSTVVDKDAILCSLWDKIDEEIIYAAKKLKVISSYNSGYDHIDVNTAKKKGIRVTYTFDISKESTADLTFGLILSIARNICIGDRYIRKENWKTAWSPNLLLGTDVYGKTLGIIGLGKIGMAVAKRARSFNMTILYTNKSGKDYSAMGFIKTNLENLLEKSDFVSLHLPLNDETFHLINEKTLRLMKQTSFLINTARGKVIDEEALINALKRKSIAGAALDVFETEPIQNSSPLLNMENVILLPHIGSASRETREKMSIIAVKNILQIFEGKEPLYEIK